MSLLNKLIESVRNKDEQMFSELINRLDAKGVPVIDLPLMVLNIETVGLSGHQWSWDRIEDWQNE